MGSDTIENVNRGANNSCTGNVTIILTRVTGEKPLKGAKRKIFSRAYNIFYPINKTFKAISKGFNRMFGAYS